MKDLSLIILLLFISLSCYGITVASVPANFYDDDAGTETNPFLISDLSNLKWLSETRDVWGSETEKFYFRQTADIDATETRVWNAGL